MRYPPPPFWVVQPAIGRARGLRERSPQTVMSKVSTGASESLYQARPRTVAFSKKHADSLDPRAHIPRWLARGNLIAACICDEYSAGPSVRPACTRCCFTMPNMIQVSSNFHKARVFIINTRPDEIVRREAQQSSTRSVGRTQERRAVGFTSASEQRVNNLNRSRDFCLKTKASIST